MKNQIVLTQEQQEIMINESIDRDLELLSELLQENYISQKEYDISKKQIICEAKEGEYGSQYD